MDNHILQEAARTYNTPCYIFDLDVFISRIRRMEQILGKQVNIYYAMKANPFLTAAAAQAAGGLEVCSPGEYAICRRARVPAQKIVLSGVNKEESHIRSVMAEQGAGTYTAESLNQLRHLEACAGAAGRTGVRVLLRLTSGNSLGWMRRISSPQSVIGTPIPIWTWQASSTIPEPRKREWKR